MKEFLIIGIDGGATKVSAWEIRKDTRNDKFSLGDHHSEKKYSAVPGWLSGFKPVDIKIQLAEKENKNVHPTADEQQQAAVYVEACAMAVEEIARQTANRNVLIGLGMPGLKTADKRGIEVVANGPRMVHYSDMLEKRLKAANINPVVPVYHLGSDADYCGIGENYADDGAFVSCSNAYYLGGGTGVADALKLNGNLLPLDHTKEWMAKTWELKSPEGLSLERYCSSNGIQSIYAGLADKEQSELTARDIYPPQIAELAVDGDKAAIRTFELVSDYLARVLLSRITTLANGWQKDFSFVNPARTELTDHHTFKGSVFEKIIIGQRLGDLFSSDTTRDILRQPVLNQLLEAINTNNVLHETVKKHYQKIDEIIVVSKLREAPALGAGVDAFHNFKNNQSS